MIIFDERLFETFDDVTHALPLTISDAEDLLRKKGERYRKKSTVHRYTKVVDDIRFYFALRSPTGQFAIDSRIVNWQCTPHNNLVSHIKCPSH